MASRAQERREEDAHRMTHATTVVLRPNCLEQSWDPDSRDEDAHLHECGRKQDHRGKHRCTHCRQRWSTKMGNTIPHGDRLHECAPTCPEYQPSTTETRKDLAILMGGFMGSEHTPRRLDRRLDEYPHTFVYALQHAHSAQGVCLKNRFGPICPPDAPLGEPAVKPLDQVHSAKEIAMALDDPADLLDSANLPNADDTIGGDIPAGTRLPQHTHSPDPAGRPFENCPACQLIAEVRPKDGPPDFDSPTKHERGLEERYDVTHLDNADHKHDNCRYFVLDPQHDKTALHSLRQYAYATPNEVLKKDLLDWIAQIDAAQEDYENMVSEWADYRENVPGDDRVLRAAHKAFVAGWKGARGTTYERGPLR